MDPFNRATVYGLHMLRHCQGVHFNFFKFLGGPGSSQTWSPGSVLWLFCLRSAIYNWFLSIISICRWFLRCARGRTAKLPTFSQRALCVAAAAVHLAGGLCQKTGWSSRASSWVNPLIYPMPGGICMCACVRVCWRKYLQRVSMNSNCVFLDITSRFCCQGETF